MLHTAFLFEGPFSNRLMVSQNRFKASLEGEHVNAASYVQVYGFGFKVTYINIDKQSISVWNRASEASELLHKLGTG